jgi:hypothetical protein
MSLAGDFRSFFNAENLVAGWIFYRIGWLEDLSGMREGIGTEFIGIYKFMKSCTKNGLRVWELSLVI